MHAESGSKGGVFEPLLPDEHLKLLPDLILYVDIRVSLVPLNDESSDIPILDYWRFNHVLEVQIESFHAMEKVNYLLLILAVM